MPITASIGLTQNSQSISGNYSNVSGKITLTWSSGSWDHNRKTSTIKINGTTYSFTTPNINPSRTTSGSQTLYTKTVNVGHNTDGTKTVSASCSVPTATSSGTVTASTSKTLTTIPRASIPTRSAYSTNLGSAVTIYTNRASSSFTHTLTYKFGNASGTIATGVGTSYGWTIPKDLAWQIKTATSGVGTIYCYTYSGSTHIGTKSVSFSAVVPDTAEFKPSISSITNAETVAGLVTKFGGYVQNHSKIKATMGTSTAYGSAITTNTITIDGVAYQGTNVTSAVLKNSGSKTISYYVRDARGRTYGATENITVFAYANPSPTVLTAFRCDEFGAIDDTGTYVKVNVNASISSVDNKNDISYKLKYKKIAETTYTEEPLTSTSYSLIAEEILPNIDEDSRYNLVLEVTDFFTTSTKSVIVPTGFTLMDFKADGTGIAFGKVSENSNELDINLASRFRKGVIERYMTATATTNGDYKINIGNIASGDVVKISFPSATLNTSNALLSIDGGATYHNITMGDYLKASAVENKEIELKYNGTWFEPMCAISGTNTRGTWTKFPDGTMICVYLAAINIDVNTPYGSIYMNHTTWTFPQEFSSIPHVSVGIGKWGNGGGWGSAFLAKTVNVGIRFYDVMPRTESRTSELNVMAIGRWK